MIKKTSMQDLILKLQKGEKPLEKKQIKDEIFLKLVKDWIARDISRRSSLIKKNN